MSIETTVHNVESNVSKYKTPLIVGGVIILVYIAYHAYTANAGNNTTPQPQNGGGTTFSGGGGTIPTANGLDPTQSQIAIGNATTQNTIDTATAQTADQIALNNNATTNSLGLLFGQNNAANQAAQQQLANSESQFNFLFNTPPGSTNATPYTPIPVYVPGHFGGTGTGIIAGQSDVTGIFRPRVLTAPKQSVNNTASTINPGSSGGGQFSDSQSLFANNEGNTVNANNILGPSGINTRSVAGDSPYLSEALSGITGPNSVGIAQNRYGTSITLPTNGGTPLSAIQNLLSGGTFGPATNNADLLFRSTQQPLNAALGQSLLIENANSSATNSLAAIQAATQLQSNGPNYEVMGTEFANAHNKPSTLQQIGSFITSIAPTIVSAYTGVPAGNTGGGTGSNNSIASIVGQLFGKSNNASVVSPTNTTANNNPVVNPNTNPVTPPPANALSIMTPSTLNGTVNAQNKSGLLG